MLQNDVLIVRGARHGSIEKEIDRGKILRRETWDGRFERSIRLPGGVNAAKLNAEGRDGVLHVTLPRGRGVDRPPDLDRVLTHGHARTECGAGGLPPAPFSAHRLSSRQGSMSTEPEASANQGSERTSTSRRRASNTGQGGLGQARSVRFARSWTRRPARTSRLPGPGPRRGRWSHRVAPREGARHHLFASAIGSRPRFYLNSEFPGG